MAQSGRRLAPVVVVVSLAAVIGRAAYAAPELPVPRHDTLQDYQNACSEAAGFTTFSMQISCVRSLVNESTDRLLNKSDPDTTQLYLLTADKLADDVRNKRITVATARVDLQRALIEVEGKHRSILEAGRAKADEDRREKAAASERASEAAERSQAFQEQRDAEQRKTAEAMNQQANQQREATIEFCIAQVQARQQQYAAAGVERLRARLDPRDALKRRTARRL